MGVYGPFPGGSWPDLKLIQNKPSPVLNGNDRDIVDNGYHHNKFISLNNLRITEKIYTPTYEHVTKPETPT